MNNPTWSRVSEQIHVRRTVDKEKAWHLLLVHTIVENIGIAIVQNVCFTCWTTRKMLKSQSTNCLPKNTSIFQFLNIDCEEKTSG
ncbi:hypothetical protein AVEN_43051-1 [Araneus ventricosus]|uniref:Uncharacterized protein n=1 Tax=Araneus ventricosus TaxID=182803 RepID=A0A4Y2SY48_ARAVE|nr:hypothetical protein AVEN_43051-1 [Araneus ventricosus]